MNRLVIGKTKKCIVCDCGKDAKYHDGIVLKSRDAVLAGFCEHHWFITQCPNAFNINNCYGVFGKSLGITPIKNSTSKQLK